jgi:type IV secretory pathway VirB4 component
VAPVNPGKLLELWDIVDDKIVTTRGAVFAGAELSGFDPTHASDDTWNRNTSGLSNALRRLPEGAALQFVVEHRALRPDELADQMGVAPQESSRSDDAAVRQRLWRYRHLLDGRLRRRRTYLFYGWRRSPHRKRFQQPSRGAFQRQVTRTDGLGQDLSSALRRGDIHMRPLPGSEMEALYYDWLHPGGGNGRIKQTVGGLSLRECLIGDNVSWDASHVRVGSTGFKVLSAKSLPEELHGAIWETISWRDQRDDGTFSDADLDFDYRIVVNMHVPPARWAKRVLNMRRNIARSQSSGGGDIEDAELAESQFTAMKEDVAGGSIPLNVGVQAVVAGQDRKILRARAEKMVRALAGMDLPVYEESLAHHTELFKSLPGMLGTWDRWMQVTNTEAADLIPKSAHSLGDPSPSLVMELPKTGEPFGLTLRSPERDNDNFLILGGSGAGKSVFLNMLLAYEVLFGAKAGRLLAIDYASPDKSSLLVAAEVFGGDYIPIRTDGQRINPFAAPETACGADGRTVTPLALGFLVDICNILFRNDDRSKEAGLYEALIQTAVKRLYEHWNRPAAPTFSDFHEALRAVVPSDDDDAVRLRELVKKHGHRGARGGLVQRSHDGQDRRRFPRLRSARSREDEGPADIRGGGVHRNDARAGHRL